MGPEGQAPARRRWARRGCQRRSARGHSRGRRARGPRTPRRPPGAASRPPSGSRGVLAERRNPATYPTVRPKTCMTCRAQSVHGDSGRREVVKFDGLLVEEGTGVVRRDSVLFKPAWPWPRGSSPRATAAVFPCFSQSWSSASPSTRVLNLQLTTHRRAS